MANKAKDQRNNIIAMRNFLVILWFYGDLIWLSSNVLSDVCRGNGVIINKSALSLDAEWNELNQA